MSDLSRADALRILGISDPVTDSEIDAVIKNEYRTWSSRTNAPDFDARTQAQRRLNDLDRAESTLLGARKDRDAPPPAAPSPSPKPEWYNSNPAPPAPRQAPPRQSTPPPPPSNQRSIPPIVNSSTARWAMILGIFSVTCCGAFAGAGALYLGYRARTEIRQSGGLIQGDGLATTGIVLGWISIGLTVLLFLASLGGGG